MPIDLTSIYDLLGQGKPSSASEFQPYTPNLIPEDQATDPMNEWMQGLGSIPEYSPGRHTSDTGKFMAGVLQGLAHGLSNRAKGASAKKLADIRQKNAALKDSAEYINRDRLNAAASGRKPMGSATAADQIEVPNPANPEKPYKVSPNSRVGQAAISNATGVGKPAAKAAAAPKPAKPPAGPKPINQQTWKMLTPDDETAVKQVEKDIEAYGKDPVRMRALQPPKLDSRGKPLPEPAAVSQARTEIAQKRAKIKEAYRSAMIWHVTHLPAGKDGEFVLSQLERRAKELGLSAELEAAAAQAEGGK